MRNTLLLILITFTISLMFAGCSSSDAKKVEMEILFYNKVSENNTEKYPKPLQEICQPLIEVGDRKKSFAFAPLSFRKVDLNKKFELDYLNNKAGNASKIKFINRQLDYYFRDNVVPDLLISPSTSLLNFTEELNRAKAKKNYFIYSSDEELEIDKKETYHSISDLRSAISKFLYENETSKIVVLYEPQLEKIKSTPTIVTQTTPTPITDPNSDEDPFAIYSLCKTVVAADPKHHHKAFELINKATILAIKQGKAPELLRRITSDVSSDENKNINDRVVWRLTTHLDDWLPVIEALTNNDETKLHDHP